MDAGLWMNDELGWTCKLFKARRISSKYFVAAHLLFRLAKSWRHYFSHNPWVLPGQREKNIDNQGVRYHNQYIETNEKKHTQKIMFNRTCHFKKVEVSFDNFECHTIDTIELHIFPSGVLWSWRIHIPKRHDFFHCVQGGSRFLS